MRLVRRGWRAELCPAPVVVIKPRGGLVCVGCFGVLLSEKSRLLRPDWRIGRGLVRLLTRNSLCNGRAKSLAKDLGHATSADFFLDDRVCRSYGRVEQAMVIQELLSILRCPACVSGPTRKPGPDHGKLALVRETWLVCQEQDCGRKYPIIDGIPVMLIDIGDKWSHTHVSDLPVPPPVE